MTTAAKPPFLLSLWHKLRHKPGGAWLFSRLICAKAPYFGSIKPLFLVLEPGRCEVAAKKRRAVTNHIGTFHAIAMCNMAEVAGGILTEISVPATHRWIPKSMTVQYLKKAETDLRAVCVLEALPAFNQAGDLPVTVKVLDSRGEEVFRAVITMWVSPKKA